MHTVDVEHRRHAEVEPAIRDLKDQALAHFPSGLFAANAAWTVIACLAHNMVRRVGQLGLEDSTWRTARTIRRRTAPMSSGLPPSPGPVASSPPSGGYPTSPLRSRIPPTRRTGSQSKPATPR